MAGYFDSIRPSDYITEGFGQIGGGLSSLGQTMATNEEQTRPFAPDIQQKIRELLTEDKLAELAHPDADPIEMARRDRQGLHGVNPQGSTPDLGFQGGHVGLSAPGSVSPWGGPRGPSAPQGPGGMMSDSQAGMSRELGNLRQDLGYGAQQGFSPDMLRTQQPLQYQSRESGSRVQQTSPARSIQPGMQSSLPVSSSGGASIPLNDSEYKYSNRDLPGLNFVQGGVKAREANKAKTDIAKEKTSADSFKTRYVQNQLNSRFGTSSALKAEGLDDKMQQVMVEQEGANRRASLRDAAIRDALKLRGTGEVAKLIKAELDDASREYDTLFKDPMTVRTAEGRTALNRALERRTLAMESIEDHLRNSGFEAESRGEGPKKSIGDKRPLAATSGNQTTSAVPTTPQTKSKLPPGEYPDKQGNIWIVDAQGNKRKK